ncbi:erythromycin esterase family protein [Paucibacter sp. DJ1R-11]|uniref:erythromycin esterase family protein n=1 Tax=Paucibacter sp. DJ1R-11 TaxID=2893556 RepID=UPI0021E39F36|nr:erythromycin esterase family protein [Paucibacter sp. DJ1R-11]MCV2365656.1 erythromycin esterase family protein [Paucibacter sp. DJ1R-11]
MFASKLASLPVEQLRLRSLSPADEDFSDLAPLAKELDGVRVLALGEQTHGGREEFMLKLRLLRYLHEKLGFEVLLLESGFYDIGRLSEAMAAGQSLDDLAPGNVFFMYSKTAEGRLLLQYLDRQQRSSRPLLLAGFDSQHSGELSLKGLLPGLRERLQQRAPELAVEGTWRPFEQLAQPLLSLRPPVPEAARQVDFLQRLQAQRQALCLKLPQDQLGGVGSDGWWCQLLGSIESQARSLWSQGRDFQRDIQMGKHAIWLMEQQFPGKKAVVWAHTVHVARGFERSPEHPQAGEVMARHWGAAYKVLQFSASGGEVLDYLRTVPLSVPLPQAGSLEALLAQPGPASLAATATLLIARGPVPLPQHSFEYQSGGIESSLFPGQLGQNWDFLIHIPRMSPVQMVR